MISNVNTIIASLLNMPKLGVTRAKANQAPDKFANTPESALRNAREFLVTSLV